jgi:spermidine synthase
VVRIARDPRLFNFISVCAPDLSIVLGDARLTLAASAQRYDLIILDAFSSDAIPVHLLTREALGGYLTRLEEGGVLVMHISNRHMELDNVVAALGAAEGLKVFIKEDHRPRMSPFDFKTNAEVALPARRSRRSRRPSVSANLARNHTGAGCPDVDGRLLQHFGSDAAQAARRVKRSR